MDEYKLYGSPMSLYTGRVRSYLIKNRIPYVEEPHATSHYHEVVLPKALVDVVYLPLSFRMAVSLEMVLRY